MLFSQEVNGYNRQEVEAHIKRLQANYEARLMEEKLKALDSERRMLDLKNERTEIENKEKNILNALSVIEKAKKFQEEGSRNFYKLLMDKLEILVKELSVKFPQLRRDRNFETLLNEFSDMVRSYKDNLDKTTDITRPIYSDNDSMRLLLNKMQDYKKGHEAPKEVHISINRSQSPISKQNNAAQPPDNTNSIHAQQSANGFHAPQSANRMQAQQGTTQPVKSSSQVYGAEKPLSQVSQSAQNYSLQRKNTTFVFPDEEPFHNQAFTQNDSGLFQTKQENSSTQSPQAENSNQAPAHASATLFQPSESGFNLEEALHPTDDLAEIMKSFDFFNDNP